MFKKIEYLLFVCIGSVAVQNSYAQNHLLVNANVVDVIGYDDDINLSYYTKIDENKFQEVYLGFDDDYEGYHEIEVNSGYLTLANIKESNKNVVFKSDLKDTSENYAYLNNWSFNETEDEEIEKIAVKLKHNGTAVAQQLYYGKKNTSSGFGAYTNNTDDNIEKWRVYSANWLNTVVLDLGSKKYITLLLGGGDNVDYALLPLAITNTILTDDFGINQTEKVKTSTYKTDYFNTYLGFNFYDYYRVEKNKENKYRLINSFDKVLLKDADTIEFNNFSIVSKSKNKTSIYNHELKEMPLKNIKKVYLTDTGLEVLTNDGPSYYDINFNKVKALTGLTYILCGTVDAISYKINSNNHTITTMSGGFVEPFQCEQQYILDIKKANAISFLSNSDSYYWDENSDYVGEISGFPTYIKVTNGNKHGIHSINYKTYAYYNNSSIIPDTIIEDNGYSKFLRYQPISVKSKEELPIAFDSIKLNQSDGLITFYKKHKIGIFPKYKTPVFTKLEKETNSFYFFEKNGKKGWLDIKEDREYYID